MTTPTQHVPATNDSAMFHANFYSRTKNQYYAAREAAWRLEAIVTGEQRCMAWVELWGSLQR